MMRPAHTPGMKPRAIFCYICGQGYGTTSIMIHVKSCQKKWALTQESVSPEKRRKCPQPPSEFLKLTGQKLTGSQIDVINTAGYNEYKEVALEKCYNCNRTFNSTAFKKHGGICTSNKPLNPLPAKKEKERLEQVEEEVILKPNYPTIKNGVLATKTLGLKKAETVLKLSEIKIGSKTELGKPVNGLVKKQPSLIQQNDLIDDYLKTEVKQNKLPNQMVQKSAQVIQKPAYTAPKKTSEVPKFTSTYEIPKVTLKQAPPAYSTNFDEIKPKSTNNVGVERALAMAEKTLTNMDLVPCAKCGRNFTSDRISKHQKVCKVNSKPKKVKMFHKKITDAEKKKINKNKTSKWKQQHEELMAYMQYGKQIKAVEAKGGNIRDLAPPPSSQNSNFLQCQFCARKFNPDSHAKHVAICKNVINKPKPVPKQGLDQSKAMTSTIGKMAVTSKLGTKGNK